ncbi:MAG TPA: mechanosensitive ion channel family protein [Candidatus Dormibacteraeota bacterium]|jgi:small-conductance mechanosensitive channel|nr:mechanosensitive ion channel family protein [Candidatus Dormibacteraeota bacterium]
MRAAQRIAAFALVIGLGATIYGIVRAGESANAATTKAKKAAAAQPVDQSAMTSALQLAQLADIPDEQALAKDALRLADYELDLAFDMALHDADAHPPELSKEALEIQARLQKAQKLQQSLQAQVKQLTDEEAKATGDRKDAIKDQLDIAQSSVDLANNEVEDAENDLTEAGGNQRGRIAQLKETHEAAAHGKDEGVKFPQAAPDQLGLVHRFQQWSALRQKINLLEAAKAQADAALASVTEQHDALAAQIEAEKFNSPDLAAHSSLGGVTQDATQSAADNVTKNVRKARSHEESKATLKMTKVIASDQHNLSSLDKRGDNEKSLSADYAEWMGLVSVREANVLKRMLFGIAIVLGIFLIGIFFNTWLEKLLGKLKMDRRQIQTLRAVTRVSLQVLAVLLVLLVILGPPTQLGTFIGLATAGLTVALKDFIVGFIGWFVLMGKNGIRLGDWVEINGVTGEVVETGMFHTVLLETGNWTDSGHPTGRRVTFTNSFAIEGHYFNFSTSGQWLWDELQITIPPGRDPFPLVAAIQKKVLEATQDSTKQAEVEWQRAAGSHDLGSISATPAINVRPGAGGIDVQVRYVTRANERYQLRNKLYQSAVELLGGKAMQFSSPEGPDTKSV